MLRKAYQYGCEAALRDHGVKIATFGNFSPQDMALLSVVPGSSLIATVDAPRGRKWSRFGHQVAGSTLGAAGGVAAGGLGGAGLGYLLAKATDADTHEYASLGAGYGGLIGGLLGRAGGSALGQSMSREGD